MTEADRKILAEANSKVHTLRGEMLELQRQRTDLDFAIKRKANQIQLANMEACHVEVELLREGRASLEEIRNVPCTSASPLAESAA